ncbi:TonB-dependent receptor [Sphingomonas sp. CFBP 8760]|nr:TonB-dependent receptor [Sphingomonas sp. CFBP 8760]
MLSLMLACGVGEASADPTQQSGTTAPAGTINAQTSPGVSQPTPELKIGAAEPGIEINDIVVVGARASQQSAIARKRNARTATDSIVADDIGSFPDRNVNEAISRIPGVALSRNGSGEGDSVAVRGNGPDLTRVELDGLGVLGTNVAAGAGAARSADLRELPAELIKSVDVVKGSTADMTEGSLGGTIQIKTRSGLDFKKPYFSVRAGGQRTTLGDRWSPDVNVVATHKFFNDRLGVIGSFNRTEIQLQQHFQENVTGGARGYLRRFDFDNSPEKTFSFNLDTLTADREADTVFGNSAETPRTLLTKAAGATSKAQCLQVFPDLALASSSSNQRTQRIFEQRTCLNQWNDYFPDNFRQLVQTNDEVRTSIDFRTDYQVTDDFIVYAKVNQSSRSGHDRQRAFSSGGVPIAQAAGTFIPTGTYPQQNTINPNAPGGPGAYLLLDPVYGTTPYNISTTSTASNYPLRGDVINVRPGSVEVDALHNVTQLTTTNNRGGVDQIDNNTEVKTRYAQIGGDYVGERLEINAMAGISLADSTREDFRTSRSTFIGDVTASITPSGLWTLELPSDVDLNDPQRYVQLAPATCLATQPAGFPRTAPGCAAVNPVTPAFGVVGDPNRYTVGQLPLTSANTQLTYTPVIGETSEKNARFDVAYRTQDIFPFITRIKTGAQYRDRRIERWGGGGYEVTSARGTFGTAGYVAPVRVPTANVRGQLFACEDTAGSLGTGGRPCVFGFTPSADPTASRSGNEVVTPQQLRDLFAGSVEPATVDFFKGFPGASTGTTRDGLLPQKIFEQLDAYKFMNLDCVKTCTASDGQVYDQPKTDTMEVTKNVYLMADAEQDLPLGLRFTGNAGVRGVFTDVRGTGFLTLRVRTYANPTATTFTDSFFRRNVTFKNRTTDWLPTYNANLWAFNDKLVARTYGGKNVARPSIGTLLPAGECLLDERILQDDSIPNGCSGRIGNPALSPFTSWNYNYSLEWYPNRDTSISFAYFVQDVKIGNPLATNADRQVFAGSDQINPITGQPVGDTVFNIPTYEDGPGYKRKGWEIATRTAFTFLPWLLQYTGADFNISSAKSDTEIGGIRAPLTGDVQLPTNESKYFINASIWYDDSKLNARLAYQRRTTQFVCITPCGGNNIDFNYPGDGYTNVRNPLAGDGYNPGSPSYVDATTYIDAKIAYNVNRNFQVYLEGRNLRKQGVLRLLDASQNFEDGTPKVQRLAYGGIRVLVGGRIQFGN